MFEHPVEGSSRRASSRSWGGRRLEVLVNGEHEVTGAIELGDRPQHP